MKKIKSEKPAYKLRFFEDFRPYFGLVAYIQRCKDSGAKMEIPRKEDDRFNGEIPFLPIPKNFGSGDYEDKCFNRSFFLAMYNASYVVAGALIVGFGLAKLLE